MGQAKRRGTFEERRAAAEQREIAIHKAWAEAAKARAAQAYPPPSQQLQPISGPPRLGANRGRLSALLIAAALGR